MSVLSRMTHRDALLERLDQKNALSFEVFPPKTEVGMEKLCGERGVLQRLYDLNPDYISCTYGAGGTNVGRNLEVVREIAKAARTVPVTHFTCIGNTRTGIKQQLDAYLDSGVDHLLALRGDLPLGARATGGDLHFASDLVKFIRREYNDRFIIAVSGSPEGHVNSPSMEKDIEHLKEKQDCGADYIMTQLCWDMDQFYRWMDAIRAAGIWLPVDVGIMPILDQKATVNMALSRNGCVMPRWLSVLISKHWIFPDPFTGTAETDPNFYEKKEDFRKAGIEETIEQIQCYCQCDIAGIHLYALNKYEDVAYIAREAGLLEGRAPCI